MGSGTIEVRGLSKWFTRSRSERVTAVDELDLTVGDDELVCLLGPSGCGKTTTLRAIAGLEEPSAGRISIGDEVVFDGARRVSVPVERRGLGVVFQSYALWSHMTVYQNILHPLRHGAGRRALSKTAAAKRVGEMLDVVDCAHLKDRYPGELSGGQQQRVALARALAYEPKVMLFDEPLSNLDAKLKARMRLEISTIRRRIGFSGLYVTHDQDEALSLADRIVVMSGGRICQMGTPTEVYETPVSGFVADFVGAANVLPVIGAVDGDAAQTPVGRLRFGARAHQERAADPGDLQVVFRPEHLAVVPGSRRDDPNVFVVTVAATSYQGTSVTYAVEQPFALRMVDYSGGPRLAVGEQVFVHVPVDRCRLVPSDGFVPGRAEPERVLEPTADRASAMEAVGL